jgi:hypothetical protein
VGSLPRELMGQPTTALPVRPERSGWSDVRSEEELAAMDHQARQRARREDKVTRARAVVRAIPRDIIEGLTLHAAGRPTALEQAGALAMVKFLLGFHRTVDREDQTA